MAQITKDAQVGQEFAGKPKKMAWERLWTFSGGPFSLSGWPRKNIHTDLDFARNCGLNTVAASATQYQGYMAQLMIDLFGEGWLKGGEMSLKFPRVVPDGDVLTAKVKVSSKENVAGGVKFGFEAWVENKAGDRVAVGTATGTVK